MQMNENPVNEQVTTDMPTKGLSNQEKTMGMLCHLLALAGYIIPFGNIIGPLIIWLIKKDESAYVSKNGKLSLNFQISVTIYALVAGLLTVILIGIPILIAVMVFNVVMIILASVKVNKGEEFKYPLSITFIH